MPFYSFFFFLLLLTDHFSNARMKSHLKLCLILWDFSVWLFPLLVLYWNFKMNVRSQWKKNTPFAIWFYRFIDYDDRCRVLYTWRLDDIVLCVYNDIWCENRRNLMRWKKKTKNRKLFLALSPTGRMLLFYLYSIKWCCQIFFRTYWSEPRKSMFQTTIVFTQKKNLKSKEEWKHNNNNNEKKTLLLLLLESRDRPSWQSHNNNLTEFIRSNVECCKFLFSFIF